MTDPQHTIRLSQIARYIEGKLPAEELAQLEEALRSDSELRRAYLEYVNLDSALIAAAALPEHEFAGLADGPAGHVAAGNRPTARRRWVSFASGRMIFAAAAVMAFGVAVAYLVGVLGFQPDRLPPQIQNVASVVHVATVEHVGQVTWRSTPLIAGGRVGASPIDIESGVLGLRFDSGASVTLHGPARFVPIDQRGGSLARGRLVGKAPEDRTGLRITAPAVELTDLGTEFALRVDETSGSDLFVIGGSVAMATKGAPAVTVDEGDGYHVSVNARVSALEENQIQDAFGDIVPKADRIADAVPLRELTRVRIPETVALVRYIQGGKGLCRDLVTGRPVRTHVPVDKRSGAVIFDGTAGIEVGGTRRDQLFDSPMTFEARIFIDHGDRVQRLFSIDAGDGNGRVGWGVGLRSRDGICRPFVTHHPSRNHEFPEAKLPIGRWFHLMITSDETGIRLHVDGEFQGETPRTGAMNIGPAKMFIGQPGASEHASGQLEYFHGKLTYVALHRRLLTPQEIAGRLKPAGRP